MEKVLKIWEGELERYKLDDLQKKPDPGSWSLGQVYLHLINATLNFHLQQARQCLKSTENGEKRKNFKGISTYHILRSLPPIKIKVPASEFYTPKQAESKVEIENGLYEVRKQMNLFWMNLSRKSKERPSILVFHS